MSSQRLLQHNLNGGFTYQILEFYVAYGMLSHAAAKNSEGFTSEELLADPQYMQDEAYKKLMKQVYPFSLPFNQPLEQARLYLGHLGTSLSQVKQIFGRNELNSTLIATDAEILGISHQEYEVLTDEKFDGTVSRKTLQEYYGFDYNNFNCSELKHLKIKLRAAHPTLKGGVCFGAARPVFRISEIFESLLPRFPDLHDWNFAFGFLWPVINVLSVQKSTKIGRGFTSSPT